MSHILAMKSKIFKVTVQANEVLAKPNQTNLSKEVAKSTQGRNKINGI